jgi:hypothetical protein
VSFKFGGVDKHFGCFVLFCFCLYIKFFFFLFVTMLLFGHNLHCNCGLHVIGVFNIFEHCLSLETQFFIHVLD